MPRATKIVATLGPASSDPEVLERLLRAGVDVVRLNFSHGKAEDHIARAALVREVAAKVGTTVALMADLQGPKIRVGKFADGKVMLISGQAFILDAQRTEPGDSGIVGLDYKELPRDVRPGDSLLLNDGLIVLVVDAVRGVVLEQRDQLALRMPHTGEVRHRRDVVRATDLDHQIASQIAGRAPRPVRTRDKAGLERGQSLEMKVEALDPCLGFWRKEFKGEAELAGAVSLGDRRQQ